MRLSEAIRSGARKVAYQYRGGWYVWDARYPKWQMDKYPPNAACAVGAALLAVGYAGPWDQFNACKEAKRRWDPLLVEYAASLNDKTTHGFRAIANRVADEEAA